MNLPLWVQVKQEISILCYFEYYYAVKIKRTRLFVPCFLQTTMYLEMLFSESINMFTLFKSD